MEIVPAKDSHIPEIIELWKEFMNFHREMDTRFPMSTDAPEQHSLFFEFPFLKEREI